MCKDPASRSNKLKLKEMFQRQINLKESRMNTVAVKTGVVSTFALALAIAPIAEAGPKGPTIVEVAIELNSDTNGAYFGAFDTLIAAVQAADPAVLKTLSGNGQHTVFAPTDDAFAALDLNEGNVGDLDQGFLTEVLLYHVCKGRRSSESIIPSKRIRTLLGDSLLQDGGVLTDNLGLKSNIIVVDVEAANGIIHAIDAVVLPYAP
jgi:uncharacterized surface protein with fasciclin (FAS1) repeats